ncbi:MAG: sigma-70 family RNA polymerase sigma factor [bacterium]|nr:sigma-70 family RNA polymerase sigma factor [bacterium]
MSSAISNSTDDLDDLIERALVGDKQALAALFGHYRRRLRQMVRLRLDRRLQGRVDPSDVLQEAYLDIVQQLPAYAKQQGEMSFFLWLRLVTGQRMMRVHREHLGTQMRNAGRDVSLHHGALPRATSVSLAAQLMGRFTSASQSAMRAEMQVKLQEAINSMEELDREIIALRHFEELSNKESAELLGLSKSAASNRYVRALARLQSVLQSLPGFMDQAT